MNILFIYTTQEIRTVAKPLRTSLQIQLGISYISSFLKQRGHNTRLLVLGSLSGQKGQEIVDQYLKRFYPDLICFTAVYSEYGFITKIARHIKCYHPNIYLLIGGCHASLNPEKIAMGVFDALCIGEGEYPTLELLSQLDKGLTPSGIPNLWIRRGCEIEKNSARPFLKDLDTLPFPDREMWLDWIGERPGDKVPVLLGRGCPFECTYCCNHALKKIAPGSYIRLRSPENILKEIEEMVERFPSKRDLYLEVETFGVNKKWALELCSKLENFNETLNEPLSFGVNLRITPDANFEVLFEACKKANFKFINIGLESGNEVLRREILKRKESNQDIINAVKSARKYDLKIIFYNLLGIPGESLADFKETVNINRICMPDAYYNSIFFPYPGTELHSAAKKKGLLENNPETKMERKKATLDLPGFSRRQIQKSYDRFDYYVYRGIKPTYKIFLRRFVLKACSLSYCLELVYIKLGRLAFVGFVKNKLK